MTVELEFSWFSSSSFIETRAFKINHKMKIEIEITILIEKKVIFSHAYCGLSCSLHGILTHVKLPDFKQLNWRIRENLSQAINNGSWYKLSLLVSKDAMIVPATCIYSVWRFARNSLDMSPWYKYYYLQFYKLGVGKVIISLVEPDICKTYGHAICLLCWTMFQLCCVHYCLCINYVTHQTT